MKPTNPIADAAMNSLLLLIESQAPGKAISRAYEVYVLACNDNNKVRSADILETDRRTLQRHQKAAAQ